MKNWFAVGASFAVAAGLVSLATFASLSLTYHVWLPIALGVGLAGLVLQLPEYRGDTRPVGLALMISSVAIVLWFHSSDLRLGPTKELVLVALEQVFLIAAVVGAAMFGLSSIGKRWNWPLVGLCVLVALVAYFSGPRGAASLMIQWVIRALSLTPSRALLFVLILRKVIHFTYYGLVALVATRVAVVGRASAKWAPLFGLSVALLFASFDERRQASEPSRTGSVVDVALDMTGAACFVLLGSSRRRPQTQPLEAPARL